MSDQEERPRCSTSVQRRGSREPSQMDKQPSPSAAVKSPSLSVNNRASDQSIINDNGDDNEDNDDNLSPPPSDSLSPPSSLNANTPKDGTVQETGERGSPHHVASEDERMLDVTSDFRDSYPRRKRASMYNNFNESTMDHSIVDDDAPKHPLRRPGQTNTAKLVLVGYWRSSKVPLKASKHSVVCFIDTRDRLRTRVQTVTRTGEPVAAQYPMPQGGSWVPFEHIVFEPHLVGLDQAQIKEYVKLRTEVMERGIVEEDPHAAELRCVEEAIARIKYGLVPDSGLPVAYGEEIPEQGGPHNSAKRRRTDSSFIALTSQKSSAVPAGAPIPFTSVGVAQNLPPLDPLPGTRPTRILIGYWHGSSEMVERDRHAVYGILGQNDMFRVKVVRETRDGRFVDGNFPSGAGALWIHYEEVVLENHLKQLSRHEVKEYCRVRQWQIDHGETDEERPQNESFAVQESQARVAHGFRTGQITVMSKPPDDKVHLVPQITSGPQQYQELRPASSARDEEIERRANGRRSLPDSRMTSGFRAINDPSVQPRGSVEPSRQLPLPNPNRSIHAYGGSPNLGMAQNAMGPISTQSPMHMSPRHMSGHLVESQGPPPSAIPQPPGNGVKIHFNEPTDIQRLNDAWIDQERQRLALSGEDAILYGGIKYEKKKAGPFKDRHVSQGTIISINGEDYVEYRVLTKPTFF